MYDKEIRKALIEFLWSRNKKLKGIIEELHVDNGRAIADLVALHDIAHCYEIKGSKDKVTRALDQDLFYHTSFKKITIVTTPLQASMAEILLPDYWGIISVHDDNGVYFRYVRGAKRHTKQNKAVTLQLLWREEMLSIGKQYGIRINKNATRKTASEVLAKNLSSIEVNKLASEYLLLRQKTLISNES